MNLFKICGTANTPWTQHYVRCLWDDEINFLLFWCLSLNTLLWNGSFFTFVFAVFPPQSKPTCKQATSDFENKRPIGPTIEFIFLVYSRHWHVIPLTKFYPNWIIGDRVLTSYRASKMAATTTWIYFRFRFGNVSHFRTSTTICIPNFDKIAQSTAEMVYYFGFLKINGRHIVTHLLPVVTLTFLSVIGMLFCLRVLI